jgi:serine protease AprX
MTTRAWNRRRWMQRLAGTALAALTTAALGAVAGPATGASAATGADAKRWLFDTRATSLYDLGGVIGSTGSYTGKNVGIALVDTGVVPVNGLTSGNVVNGPDLSFESQAPKLRYQDTFGHGTHLAGIMVGKDTSGSDNFTGVAPDATLTSVKVGVANGALDVSQAIAAVDWVVAHRNDDLLHPIRVLTLAYGTDGTQDYRVDPLTHAVENAWRAGIVVVVAGGNTGTTAPKLANPAYDPYVIAVGAADPMGTTTAADDTVTDFSSRGDASRRVDLLAPGRSIVSLRDPGSYVDTNFPAARVGTRFFKGSGTSQAAAVVSGAVAQLLQQRPYLTPDQVKALLTGTASQVVGDPAATGAGELNLSRALLKAAPLLSAQTWTRSTGTGSLEAARGTHHVADNGVELTDERDIFGPFSTASWAKASSSQTAWNGGSWMGHTWTGSSWTGAWWTKRTWGSASWSGFSWSGFSWSSRVWSSASWNGFSWSGFSWSGFSWSGFSWSGFSWSGADWSEGNGG